MSRIKTTTASLATTLLIGAMAAGLGTAQIFYLRQSPDLALPIVNQRVALLRQAADPVKRDALCIPMSAYARKLDRVLDPNARVFITGMLGKTNAANLGYYCFLRNYLFPREVQISLDGKPIFRDGWYEGVPCDAPDPLRAKGYDLLMVPGTNHSVAFVPLSPRGKPR
jgi:hypothetical protein